uniref:Uncharacterized protein n=1 Tax=Anopheles atroparvus TaxID=41427 RepID=A0AAG5DFT5_ANOAO
MCPPVLVGIEAACVYSLHPLNYYSLHPHPVVFRASRTSCNGIVNPPFIEGPFSSSPLQCIVGYGPANILQASVELNTSFHIYDDVWI